MGGDELLHALAADAEVAGDDDRLARQGVGQGGFLPGSVEAQAGGAQPGDHLQVLGPGEEVDDAAGDDFAHVVDFEELLLRGGGEGVDVAEVARDALGGRLADVADAQREEDPLEGDLLRRFQACEEALGGLVLPAFEAEQLVFADIVQVRGGAGQAGGEELLDRHLAGQDVHGLAADEVQQAALDLHRAAVLVRAEPFGFVLSLDQGRAAIGADGREDGRLRAFRAVRGVDAGDFRDDLPAFLDIDPVAHADVQQGHLVGVVEGGALDERAAELHGGEVRDGGHGAGASDLVVDAEQLRAGLLGLEFIGHRPAGRLGRVAQRALGGEFVDLDDDAVRGEGEELAGAVPVIDVVLDLRDVVAEAALLRDGQAPARGGVEGLAVGGEVHRLGGDVVERTDEAAVRHLFGIDELQRAGSGVARVGEGGFFLRLAFAVEGVEGRVGHQDFAADLEFRRVVPVELLRDAGDAADVLRDVVALDAVAAGEGLCEPAVPVGQANGGAIELELAAVAEANAFEGFLGACDEFFDFSDGVGIAQRKHRVAVRPLDKALPRLRLGVGAHGGVEVGADAAGGGVGAVELRELGLQALQLVHELVELIVRHRRGVVHIVAPAVLPEDLPELVYPYFCSLFLHTLARIYARI